MSQSETTKSPYKVQVLDRALSILDALANTREHPTLAELAHTVELHKSTAHRLLMILERQRIVEREPRSGRYHLGLRLFELGTLAIASFNFRERAGSYLEQIVYQVDETVHLCVLDGGEILYLDKVEPSRSVRMASRIGTRNPVHCTAVGKAILAHLPERDLNDILHRRGLKRFTSNTITTPAELKAQLRAVLERGYSIDNEEIEDGVRCVGAPVLDHSGRPVAAISVSAPSFRLPASKVPTVAAALCQATRALSKEIGFNGAWPALKAVGVPLRFKRQVQIAK